MKLNNDWDQLLKDEFEKPYFRKLVFDILEEYKRYTVFPELNHVMKAFRLCSYEQTKVVLVGQDPYHNDFEAMGLSFSVPKGVKIPPSLHNIFLEMSDDLKVDYPRSGDLTSWAKQGVFLLNSILTVRKNEPLSHKDLGWATFTDAVISMISQKHQGVVFWLMGSYARSKRVLIDQTKHYIIETVHPSPLSAYRGFFGSKLFSKTNRYLMEHGLDPIKFDLSIEENYEKT